MSLLEDLFVENLLENPDESDREITEENQQGEENELGENEENSGTKVEPKKRIVKNPQPKLNADRLRGPRGIATLEKVFLDIKFKGKGYEKEDLQNIMWKLEHWCHRLYPKFQFDDCLEKIEKLGSKKTVRTYMAKIRQNLVDINELEHIGNSTEDQELLPPNDMFDDLIDEQIASNLSNSQMQLTNAMKERIEHNKEIAKQKLLAKRLAEQQQLEEYENIGLDEFNVETLSEERNSENNIITSNIIEESNDQNEFSNQTEITEEQRSRIEHQKQLAIQRRLERIKEQKQPQNN